jgi:hypothetical protein
MKTPADIKEMWKMRAYGVFHLCFLSYLTWHADSPVELLLGCGMLAAVLIVAFKLESAWRRLCRARKEA